MFRPTSLVFAALLCVQSLGFNIQSTIKPRHTSCVQQPTVLGMSTTTVSRTSPLFLADVVEIPEKQDEDKKLSLVAKLKRWYAGGSDDGLTFRQRLAKMGMMTMLSYGFVSNFSHTTFFSIAWFLSSKRSGASPLAPGQYKAFLAVYTGFWVFNNVIRPMRVGLAVAMAPYFDRVINSIQKRTGWSRGLSIGSLVFVVNVVGTLVYQGLGIVLASLAAGVPVFPAK